MAPMTEQSPVESSILHISIRAWLALIFTGTVCYMGIMAKKVEEPLYSLAIAAVSYYFGGGKIQPYKKTPLIAVTSP